ncbi:NUDIX domain-containing protein [Moraxella sp. FZFQ2102]|uniref:NUDIX domain-containing protein n=1 Tax=Moraxella sp. FZFQ2102 TaxID=2953752 RepID=UPI00209C574A|nr:NUDIX domain-containing protein [Moraxella sp. FZFQ2102]USZ15117.1 NUDIX domain-containing protein [Moraxella sp. FZFQ2102]
MKLQNPHTNPIIRVAVAVIRHKDEFLLAMRKAHQHQGGKLEFVGGKIEQSESAPSALIREVQEEIGLDLQTDQLVRFGVIRHDYPDKSVELHIYQANLNNHQYQEFRHRTHGTEGQSLHWLGLSELLASADRLPKANVRIIDWLSMPSQIIISHALAHFAGIDEFINYYVDKLPNHAWFYLRPQADLVTTMQIYRAMRSKRADVQMIAGDGLYRAYQDEMAGVVVKISAKTLAQCEDVAFGLTQDIPQDIPQDVRLLLGVHDEVEVQRANRLAVNARVLAGLVSPVLPTLSHPDAPALSWDGFEKLASQLSMPAIALGGLSLCDNITAKQHGAIAISGIRGFL